MELFRGLTTLCSEGFCFGREKAFHAVYNRKHRMCDGFIDLDRSPGRTRYFQAHSRWCSPNPWSHTSFYVITFLSIAGFPLDCFLPHLRPSGPSYVRSRPKSRFPSSQPLFHFIAKLKLSAPQPNPSRISISTTFTGLAGWKKVEIARATFAALYFGFFLFALFPLFLFCARVNYLVMFRFRKGACFGLSSFSRHVSTINSPGLAQLGRHIFSGIESCSFLWPSGEHSAKGLLWRHWPRDN